MGDRAAVDDRGQGAVRCGPLVVARPDADDDVLVVVTRDADDAEGFP